MKIFGGINMNRIVVNDWTKQYSDWNIISNIVIIPYYPNCINLFMQVVVTLQGVYEYNL